MKSLCQIFLTFLLLCSNIQSYAQDINFNDSWLFLNQETVGVEAENYNDVTWKKLDLPHDWAIAGPFDKKYSTRTGGLPIYGTGWYRKHFVLPKTNKNKIIRIEFEGAMYDAHVWINGHFLGNRPFGYIGFEFDMSKYLKFDGSENVVAVKLSPKDLSSRWYPGAGIYRSVWLRIDEPVHVAQWGTFISTPTVTDAKAVVQTETVLENKSDKPATVILKHEYYTPDGKLSATVEENINLESNSKKISNLYSNIEKPIRWDIDTPKLYKAITTISENDTILDRYETRFGIRHISYSTEGFFLNGKKIRFNGVCLHQDNGSLGTADYRRADERKLQIMKSMGVNAIRTTHNPPSSSFLELCDELGLLVLDEAFDVWKMPKVENGYNLFFEQWSERDLKDMIRRDRNHPSVIMWSLGNEIMEQDDKKDGWKVAKRLHDYCKELDKTRPTTIGFNRYSAPYEQNMAQQVDIVGVNYKPTKYTELRENYPNMPFYGSETSSCTSSRGVYHLPIEKYDTHESKQITSYDLIGPPWAYPPDVEFHFQEQNPYCMGEFIWTGFDYLGEPTPFGGKDNITHGIWTGDWPSRSAYFGAVDLCGFPKDRFYLYQSQWTTTPMIHLLPHWNWEGMEGTEIPVYCYTNCDEAELFLNGKSLGKKTKGKDLTALKVNFLRYEPKTFKSKYRLSWNVPYQAGILKVVGYKNGVSTIEKVITTAGKPYKIKLTIDRNEITANGTDLAYVTVHIEDKNGTFCPLADNLIQFEVSGLGKLIAVDNGNPATIEPFQVNYRKVFNGMCLAIIKSDKKAGEIKLKATSKGLKAEAITIVTKN
jgi:beta-galactosidase